jgi:hypothetical protein
VTADESFFEEQVREFEMQFQKKVEEDARVREVVAALSRVMDAVAEFDEAIEAFDARIHRLRAIPLSDELGDPPQAAGFLDEADERLDRAYDAFKQLVAAGPPRGGRT